MDIPQLRKKKIFFWKVVIRLFTCDKNTQLSMSVHYISQLSYRLINLFKDFYFPVLVLVSYIFIMCFSMLVNQFLLCKMTYKIQKYIYCGSLFSHPHSPCLCECIISHILRNIKQICYARLNHFKTIAYFDSYRSPTARYQDVTGTYRPSSAYLQHPSKTFIHLKHTNHLKRYFFQDKINA